MSDSLIEVVLGGENQELTSGSRRTEAISHALREASRQIRSNRRVVGGGGFKRRRGERLFAFGVAASAVAFVAVPVLLASLYFGLIASDRYQSEMQFSLRNYESSGANTLLSLTGLPTGNLMQEAKVVESFIKSRAMVDFLNERLDLFSLYNGDHIDYLSRFPTDEPVEEFMEYWDTRASVDVDSLSGIVRVRLQAFSAEDAHQVNALMLEAVEQVVNDLSARARADLLGRNEKTLQSAQDKLVQLGESLAELRNDTGLIDPELYAKAITSVATELDVKLSEMRVKRSTLLASVDADSPQMQFLTRQIETLEAEVRRLRQEIASPGSTGGSLSSTKATFDRFLLEQEIARKQYAQASLEYEKARIDADRRQIYAAILLKPTLPEDAEYPKRFWSWSVVLAICLAGWGALLGVAVLVRNHLAV